MSDGFYQINQMRKNYPVKVVPHRTWYEDDGGLLRNHWHRSIELIFAHGGALELWVNGISRTMSEEIAIINNGEIHGIPKLVTAHQEGCSVLIAYTFLKELNPKIDQLWFEMSASPQANQHLKDAMLRMLDVYESEHDWYNLQLRSIMYEMIYLLFTEFVSGKNEEHTKSMKTAEFYKQIITYLNEHYKENLRLRDIAAMFGYNTDYFSRMFKDYIGEDFRNYLKRLRLYHAHKELIWTEKPLVDIALDNGFSDSKAFIRDFKENFAMTPLKYRKMQKEIKK